MGIILFGVIFILLLIPVIITSLFYMERYYKIILKFFRGVNWRGINFKGNLKWVDLKILIKRAVIKSLFINSLRKLTVWGILFSFFLLLFVQHFKFEKLYFYVGLLFLILVAFLLAYKNDKQEVNVAQYGTKLSIMILYPLVLLLKFLENVSNVNMIAIIVFFTALYSYLFLKSVMDIFKSTFMHLANFIFIYVFFNFIIGAVFGSFYIYNDHFEYHYSGEYKGDGTLLILYKGLEPFYNYPIIQVDEGNIAYIPMFEFIIGNIFNIILVGIFISYFVNKLSTKNERS
ncbi:hypothetical protein [Bacillus altitudinis]|uniref:hypothetical protein n=1 Tax=Bacillus altitudinis TaxID=293387 RepID=UPI0011A65D1F|nr:hypothetical protein [Bacillus altitudinis]MBR0632547.1 hypothetical protein [Bacillus altitudinis C101]NQW97466.1 hypothetical protein [Bacillus stratosphericus]UTV32828.1 hypothetical protein NM966_19010 [Bacillus altitudinis]